MKYGLLLFAVLFWGDVSCLTSISIAATADFELEEQIFNKKRKAAEAKAARESTARKKATERMKAAQADRERIRLENIALEAENHKLDSIRFLLNNSLYDREREIESMYTARIETLRQLNKNKQKLDSLAYMSVLDSLQLIQQDLVLRQQTVELRSQTAQRNLLIVFAIFLCFVAFSLFYRWKTTRKYNNLLKEKNNIIIKEQKNSEKLLLNILPVSIAEELKLNGTAESRKFNEVTVLFSDFVSFSTIAAQLGPKALVEHLNYCFNAFDAIIEKYGLEKIKTIGDAYMCAGGVPEEDDNHAVKVVKAALEIQQFLADWQSTKTDANAPLFIARIGVHTGPIVAGVVGTKKFAYDIWGNTVNIASRMESCAEPGRINISAATYAKVKDHFSVTPRGSLEAKNVGILEMFFIEEKRVDKERQE